MRNYLRYNSAAGAGKPRSDESCRLIPMQKYYTISLRRGSYGNLLLAVFVLACAFSAVAQYKHPFTFEDMMALRRVEEPVPSPDGKWVLFAAVDVDLKANTKTPHVWVVPIAGGKEQEIISDQDADR